MNGLKTGVDAVEKGFTDAGNFVIDTTGLIGDLGKDIGSSIAHTATDIGHTVVNIGKDIGHAIGSKFDLLTVCSKIMNTHQGMVYLIWFCFSLSSFFYISFNLDMVYYTDETKQIETESTMQMKRV